MNNTEEMEITEKDLKRLLRQGEHKTLEMKRCRDTVPNSVWFCRSHVWMQRDADCECCGLEGARPRKIYIEANNSDPVITSILENANNFLPRSLRECPM